MRFDNQLSIVSKANNVLYISTAILKPVYASRLFFGVSQLMMCVDPVNGGDICLLWKHNGLVQCEEQQPMHRTLLY